ncbi:hypothetical protein Vretimale_912 [Volvox reticuliferus]|uniref:Uncharacterized protein n=1 Tax=Volvox reticuliferus TaxID=1737510 RepID=A0A8J4D318_9CHLO|nr:hypothetical protein Vretifemale_2165 [Volvox reticuliferus]GIL94691.1 hypothetical protein Vretimale_912 [Volvox reticuliferus]
MLTTRNKPQLLHKMTATQSRPKLSATPQFLILFLQLVFASYGISLPQTSAAYDAATVSSSAGVSPVTSILPAPGPKPANLSSCPNLRIGIINGVPFHYEVVAGLMHTFRPYSKRTDMYLNRNLRSANGDGSWDILRRSRINFRLITRSLLTSISREKPFYDLLILVSLDYELDAIEELLRHIRRRVTVAMVHNGDFNDTQRLIRVAESGGSIAQLVTLSPHTATSLAAATGRAVEWVLPVYPFRPNNNCLQATEVDLLGMCLRGFAIQGKFSNQRRNYSSLWKQMETRREELTTGYAKALFRINLLGKGQEDRLGLPQDLEPLVKVYRRLPYRGFFDQLHHSFAILPLLASPRYLTHKFSSSILSALISGTPLITDRAFLAVYSMLNEQCVYLQKEGETEVDVMLRVMATPASELLAVRQAMVEARKRSNERAVQFFARILTELCSKSASVHSGGGQ